MKAYQARAHVGLALALTMVSASVALATPRRTPTRSRVRTLVFRPSDLPGFKLTQSGSLNSAGFMNFVVEGESPYGQGWEQQWKRPASKAHAQAGFVTAGALLCDTSVRAAEAVRGRQLGIASAIDWQPRLRTQPPAAADRLFVSPRDRYSDGVYQVFGTTGKLAFHIEIHPAQGPLAPGDPSTIDRLVRQLLGRYTRMK